MEPAGSSGELELEERWWCREESEVALESGCRRRSVVACDDTLGDRWVKRLGDSDRREWVDVRVRTARFDRVREVRSRAMVAMDNRCCLDEGRSTGVGFLLSWRNCVVVGDGQGVNDEDGWMVAELRSNEA